MQPILQRGRFELAKNYVRNEWLRAGAFALVMLLFGGGMAVYGAYVTRDLLETGRLWRAGTATTNDVGYGGEVVSHYAILKRYDLKVSFMPEDGEEPLHFEAKFHRFFTGPDEGDEMTVKYDPSAPTFAVCSWQYEALVHGWIWAAMVWGLALCGVFAAVVVTRDLIRTLTKVKEISLEGQLMRARVEEAKHGGTNKVPLLILRYQTPRGEIIKQTFQLNSGGPYFVNEGQEVLVLSTVNERSSHALREDGYPLAVKPEVESAS